MISPVELVPLRVELISARVESLSAFVEPLTAALDCFSDAFLLQYISLITHRGTRSVRRSAAKKDTNIQLKISKK